MKTRDFARFVLPVAASLALGGCVTPKVWEEGQFARYHEPAREMDLRLFYSGRNQDVLVEYTEVRDNDAAMRRRAFWLEPNADLLHERRRPHFVTPKAALGLTPISLASPSDLPRLSASEEIYAVVSTNGGTFSLCSAGKEIGSYELPVYRDASGRVKQVLLTPLAVTADVTVVGAVIAYATLPSWWVALNALNH